MAISCLNTGRGGLKSLEQNVTIGTMIAAFLLLILSPILGMVTYTSSKGFDSDLCKQFGIDRIENDKEPAIIALSVLSLICFVLASMSFYYIDKNHTTSSTDMLTPTVIIIVSIASAIGAGFMGAQDEESTDNEFADPKVREWCYKSNTTAKNLNITMTIFLSINIAVFVAWITSLVANSCEIY